MQRRLAAIVHADIAGFTRMMEGSETRTFRHLKTAQIEVWRPAIQAANGRLVGTAGDAMLAEFGSAVTAVSAALDIQERMSKFNDTIEPEQRMNFRIGVHLGEVIVDDEDQNIFGDGVNLAARIQALAEPGGIAVSRAVRDLVELRIEYAFVDGGAQTLKNVSRSVQIFHVKHAKSAVPSNTTTRMVPQVTLRFEGTDSGKTKHSFEVTLEKLMSRSDGMVIGRSADQCEFVVAHPTVSRRHARLRVAGEALQVEDLGSTNGTRVGEQTLKNVSRSVQIFHVKHAKSAVPANTTTRMVPQVTLRFEGTDSGKTKHSFEVTLEKLMSRSDGMVIGRSADQCEFVVAHPTVSRRHARLRVTGEAIQVEDLGSTNGTKVGEQALKAGEPVALHAGDKLRLGDVDMLVRHL